MTSPLAMIALLLNGVGVLYALLSPGAAGWRRWREQRQLGRIAVIAPLASLLLVLLLALFTSAVTSAWGVLVGGLCAFAILCIVDVTASPISSLIGLLTSAGAGPALLLCLLPHSPGGALIWCAFTGIVVIILSRAALRVSFIDGGCFPTAQRNLELFAVVQFMVVSGVLLAIAKFPESADSSLALAYWATPPLLLGVGALAGVFFSTRDGSLLSRAPLLGGCAMALVMVLACTLLQWKLLPALSWQLPLYATLAFAAMLAVMSAEERLTGDAEFRPLLLTFGLLLLGFVVSVIAFRRLQGFGEVLALLPIPALLGTVAMGRSREQYALTPAIGMGALLVLLLFSASRLLMEHGVRSYPLDFQRQYDFLSLLLGIAGTMGVMALLQRAKPAELTGKAALVWNLAMPLLMVILAVGAPSALIVLWGSRTVLALILGMAGGAILWMTMAAWTTGTERSRVLGAAPHLFLLTALVSAIHFVPLDVGHTFSRPMKMIVLIILIAVASLIVLVETFGQKRISPVRE